MTRSTGRAALAAGLVALLAAACAPGSESPTGAESPEPTGAVETDVAALDDVTLTVWDQEVRGGQNEQIERLNAAFEEQYPNITIERVSRSFDDLKTTLRLALTGNDAPDVVQANNGRSDMGEFVKADQLQPLDAWADAYGWTDRYPESVLQYSRYSEDGSTFGEGNLYGLPQVGEVVGIYYNKAKLAELGIEVPQTWEEFEQALATAKQAGMVPIQFGNLDQWPGIHEFGLVQAQHVPTEEVRQLGFGREGASWTTPENQAAAEQLASWAQQGYFNEGFNGKGYDPAWQDFAAGNGVFLIAGTWLLADLEDAMGDDVGFMLPPGETADAQPVTTGGTGLPFAITSAADEPAAAAAYIDFLTNENAMQVLAETGNLPVVDTAEQEASSQLQSDVFTAFGRAAEGDGLVPYLDYATPTMYDTIGPAVQDLLAGQRTPEEALQALEDDYSSFVGQ